MRSDHSAEGQAKSSMREVEWGKVIEFGRDEVVMLFAPSYLDARGRYSASRMTIVLCSSIHPPIPLPKAMMGGKHEWLG